MRRHLPMPRARRSGDSRRAQRAEAAFKSAKALAARQDWGGGLRAAAPTHPLCRPRSHGRLTATPVSLLQRQGTCSTKRSRPATPTRHCVR